MSKPNSATLEAKMDVPVRTSQVFSMEYRLGANPKKDVLIEKALVSTAEGDPDHWVKAWNGR